MTSDKNAALLTTRFSLMIISLYVVDKIGFLINPSYYWYVLICACFSLLIALTQLFSFKLGSFMGSHRSSLFDRILFITLLISIFVVPITPLGSRGINVSSEEQVGLVIKPSNNPTTTNSPTITNTLGLSEWVATLEYADNSQQFDGQAIVISGFVSKYTDSGYILSVYLISCCVVDATPMNMTITSTDRPAIDSWNKVEGKIKLSGRQPNQILSLTQTPLTSQKTPSNPYTSK